MIQYKCGKCGALLESPSSMAGQEDKCERLLAGMGTTAGGFVDLGAQAPGRLSNGLAELIRSHLGPSKEIRAGVLAVGPAMRKSQCALSYTFYALSDTRVSDVKKGLGEPDRVESGELGIQFCRPPLPMIWYSYRWYDDLWVKFGVFEGSQGADAKLVQMQLAFVKAK